MTTAAPNATPGWGAETRAMLTLAWPLVIAQLAQNALYTTDVIMMGWLGPQYLAAGTLASAFFHPFLICGLSLVSAVAPVVAQAIGGRDIKGVRRTLRQGFWVAATTGLVIFPFLWNVRPIMLALGQDPVLAEMAQTYLRIAVFSLFPALGIAALRSFLSAHSTTQIILWVTVSGIVVNALGNYALMFGNFGLPRMELQGAAITTVLVNLAMFATLLGYVLTHRRFRRYHVLARFWRPDWPRFFRLYRIGLPIGLTVLAEVGMFSVSSIFMGWLGTTQLAAHAVALQCASLAFMVPLGIGVAATVRVGLAQGRRDPAGVGRAGWTSMSLGIGFMLCTAALFILFPAPLVQLFLDPLDPDNQAALALAVTFLGVAALFQLFDGGQVVAAHALRGLTDTKIPMVIAILCYWVVGMPVSYLLAFPLGLEGLGIWLGLAAGLAAAAFALIARFAMRERLGLVARPR